MDIIDKIITLRVAKSVSLQRLQQTTGKPMVYFKKREQRDGPVEVEYLKCMANVLGVSLSELVGAVDTPAQYH